MSHLVQFWHLQLLFPQVWIIVAERFNHHIFDQSNQFNHQIVCKTFVFKEFYLYRIVGRLTINEQQTFQVQIL